MTFKYRACVWTVILSLRSEQCFKCSASELSSSNLVIKQTTPPQSFVPGLPTKRTFELIRVQMRRENSIEMTIKSSNGRKARNEEATFDGDI